MLICNEDEKIYGLGGNCPLFHKKIVGMLIGSKNITKVATTSTITGLVTSDDLVPFMEVEGNSPNNVAAATGNTPYGSVYEVNGMIVGRTLTFVAYRDEISKFFKIPQSFDCYFILEDDTLVGRKTTSATDLLQPIKCYGKVIDLPNGAELNGENFPQITVSFQNGSALEYFDTLKWEKYDGITELSAKIGAIATSSAALTVALETAVDGIPIFEDGVGAPLVITATCDIPGTTIAVTPVPLAKNWTLVFTPTIASPTTVTIGCPGFTVVNKVLVANV